MAEGADVLFVVHTSKDAVEQFGEGDADKSNIKTSVECFVCALQIC